MDLVTKTGMDREKLVQVTLVNKDDFNLVTKL